MNKMLDVRPGQTTSNQIGSNPFDLTVVVCNSNKEIVQTKTALPPLLRRFLVDVVVFAGSETVERTS